MTDPAAARRCVKCRGGDIYTRWHEAERYGSTACDRDSHAEDKKEHLHHVCRTCGYDWTEPTRDCA